MVHVAIPDPTDLPDLDIELANAIADGDEQAVRALVPTFRAHRLQLWGDVRPAGPDEQVAGPVPPRSANCQATAATASRPTATDHPLTHRQGPVGHNITVWPTGPLSFQAPDPLPIGAIRRRWSADGERGSPLHRLATGAPVEPIPQRGLCTSLPLL